MHSFDKAHVHVDHQHAIKLHWDNATYLIRYPVLRYCAVIFVLDLCDYSLKIVCCLHLKIVFRFTINGYIAECSAYNIIIFIWQLYYTVTRIMFPLVVSFKMTYPCLLKCVKSKLIWCNRLNICHLRYYIRWNAAHLKT